MDTHSLGIYLRDAREARELTIQDAVDRLKIRRTVLESFEQGDFTITEASPVQIKGFLRNYAEFLGLDSELVIQYFDSATEPRRGRRRRERPENKPPSQSRRASQELPIVSQVDRPDTQSRRVAERPDSLSNRGSRGRRRRSGILNMLLIIFVALISLTIILFVVTELLDTPQNDFIPDSQSLANNATETPPPTVEAVPERPVNFVQLPEFQEDFDGRGVAVTLRVQQRMWMRVTIDGIVVEDISRLYEPGEPDVNIPADNEVIVHSSNAAGLQVFYNGELQGSYGGRGQQAEIAFRADGVEIITANIPEPTIGPTEPPTATVISITDTPNPTATIDAVTDADPDPTLTPLPSGTPFPTLTDIPLGTPEGTSTGEAAPTQAQAEATEADIVAPTGEVTTVPTDQPTTGPTAILPPRVTPSDPTPTKPAS